MSAVAGRSPLHVGGLTDDQLVKLARDGHEPAFDAIVHRYQGPLVSYCRRWLDAHRAEEVVQHTLMKAFLCLRDDARPLTLRPWLYRVAHNAALNAVEKKGSDWEQLDENYDGVPQPPQVAELRARFLQVVDGIESLPRRQRDALVLNEFEGRCYADIAAELGTSESGVRGLLRRARRQLRDAAAALLLPFPALREFVRSDAGRLHVDRAGELIGSAGAVGGVGVAGGVTKVAAGLLAAGTIAGGGTAIEHQQDSFRTPAAKAAEPAPAPASAASDARGPTTVAAAAGNSRGAPVTSTLTMTGSGLAHTGEYPAPGSDGESLAGVEQPPDEQEPAAEPEPLVPESPLPVGSDPRDEEAPADKEKEEQPPAADEDDTAKDPNSAEPPADDEPAAPEEEEPAPSGDEPNSPPATPTTAPLEPKKL